MHAMRWNKLKNLLLVSHPKYLQISLFSKRKLEEEIYLYVCIERHPVITSEINNLEQTLYSTLLESETLNSNKSNSELEKDNNLKKLKLINKRNIEFSSFNSFKLPLKDLEKYSQTQLKNLRIPSRLPDKSINYLTRRLQESLFFVTKQSIGINKEGWDLPKDIIRDGESIKQAAQRILNYNCGDKFNTFLYGNTPFGYSEHKNVNDCEEQQHVHSFKIFYFLARYINGDFSNNTKYRWLNMQELQLILPKSIYVQMCHIFKICK